ncbi:MAG: cadherin domain-containing protein, partial [Rhodopirellula sp. JB055]|uniref:cadherin domain-containing protein n=1 Tax=Rhodopirellula sp. JB055 TaxID=3342846 RepID=UPI00370B1225
APGTPVGITADAFDLDATNNTITYSLTDNPGGLFQIDPNTGEVTVATSLDYETASSHEITVTATSSDSSTESQSFTILVNDVNEFVAMAGGDIDGTANEVDENSAGGATVGITVFASDADATNNNVHYTMLNDAGGRFEVGLSSGIVTVAANSSLNFETEASHDIIVRAISEDGSFVDQTFTIQLRDVNEAPVASHDGTYSTTVSLPKLLNNPSLLANDVDVDSDPLRIVIVAHPANGTLQIDSNGHVTYTPNAGFLGTDSFQYLADDGFLTSNTATVTIEVVPGNTGGSGDGGDGDSGDNSSGGGDGDGDGSTDGNDNNDSDPSEGEGNETELANTVGTNGNTGSNSGESTQSGRRNFANQSGDSNENSSGDDASGSPTDNGSQGVRAMNNQSSRLVQRFGFGNTSFQYDILVSSDALLDDLVGETDLDTLLTWHLTDDGSVRVNESYENDEIHVGAVGTTLGLASIGYVLWALRGGMFIATMYAGIPSWRMLDPASLLSAYRGADGAAQDKVEEMLD